LLHFFPSNMDSLVRLRFVITHLVLLDPDMAQAFPTEDNIAAIDAGCPASAS
jgi:hypothetical protein